MKVRAQRTHHMGTSNRDQSNFDTNYRTQSVFERSYNKSKSLYGQPDASKFLEINSTLKQAQSAAEGRVKPFLGTHSEFQSTRFDKNNKRQYRPSKMILAPTQKIFDMANNLNKQVKQIQQEFKDKRINMHKLRELKRTFVKNNRERRNMKPYFENFVGEDGLIDQVGMKRLVKEYGFDVNNEEIQLIFKMSTRHRKDKVSPQGLPIDGFVQLMTKDDVFYNTLKIGDPNDVTFGEKTKHFPEGIHEVLRNKFPKLKQAFKIYRSRQQEIDFDRYNYVMKKMDLTDLVIPQDQRDQIYQNYVEDGYFNVERFIGDIAEQEYGKKIKVSSKIDFNDNLRTNQQKNQQLLRKVRNNSLKNMSALEYQRQLEKATNVISQLKQILADIKDPQIKKNTIKQIFKGSIINRGQASSQIENLMKNNGINFQKEDYDAFVGYLDFDVKDEISSQRIFKNIFQENQKQAQERFQRKFRNEAPKAQPGSPNRLIYQDDETALQSIRKIRDHKMNPQNRELFKYFDQDKDGFIASEELTKKLEQMNLLEKWEINALAVYLDPQNKGAIDFQTFTKKISKQGGPKELPFVKTSNSRSFSQWKDPNSFLTSKRNFIKTMNQPSYQRPSQFSAWPERLKQSDLSLIQPPTNSGMYASEIDRFSERKQDYGLKQKNIINSIKEKKIKKLAQWNEKLNRNIQQVRQRQQDKQAARNYALRLTQQKYEQNCHRKF